MPPPVSGPSRDWTPLLRGQVPLRGDWTFTEFTVGAVGNLHTIGPPLLWINLQWCKAIKPMWYGYLFILITRGSGTHCIVANKCITRRGPTSQTYLLPSLFYSALHVWVQRHSGSPPKHPLDGYPIRLGPFPPSRILFGPPLAIIDEMKVTDGEYEETVRMDGPPVWPRQSPPRGECINMHLHVNLLKRTFRGWVGVGGRRLAAVCFLIWDNNESHLEHQSHAYGRFWRGGLPPPDESASSDRREVSTWCANVVDSNVQLQLLLKSKHPDPAMAGCRTDKSLVQSFIGQETISGHFQRYVITHYNIIINITWAVFLLLITWGGLSALFLTSME